MENKTNEIVNRVLSYLDGSIDDEVKSKVSEALYIVLNDYSFEKQTRALVIQTENETVHAIQMFLVSKKVEGCTDNTIRYYSTILKSFFNHIEIPLKEIQANDIRFYIATRSMQDNLSKTSQDNELRVLKSFFKWCDGEGFITKIPTLNIAPIKQEKRIKKPFTEIEIERLRDAAKGLRDKAIVDVLLSTGVRVSELCGMSIPDLENDEIIVFGKGEKERTVYLNAKAQFSLKQYLETRTDNNNALFVQSRSPYERLTKSGVEVLIRAIGKNAKIENCHPHRFRRTAATIALNRGMPLEQVSQMLGHEDIQTTTIYARSSKDNIKASHKKYVN